MLRPLAFEQSVRSDRRAHADPLDARGVDQRSSRDGLAGHSLHDAPDPFSRRVGVVRWIDREELDEEALVGEDGDAVAKGTSSV